jgi:small subunit ribosomal protein S36
MTTTSANERAGDGGTAQARIPSDLAAPDGPGAIGLRTVPAAVWGLTALFAVLLAVSSVAAPLFHAPDEFVHADLVLLLADDPHYPEHDGRRTAAAVKRVAIPYFGDDARAPDKAAADAPPKAGRPNINVLGGSGDHEEGSFNQQPQHPPLYYQALALALRVERRVLPGAEPPAAVTEIGLLRVLNAAMVVLLPLAAWATATRLGADRRTATTAAALVLVVPQLTHIGSTINNDNLLTALASVLAVLLAGVVRGDRSWRTAGLVAVVTGLALLTKAFALLLLPWIAVAYLVAARCAARRGERPLPVVVIGAATGVGAALISGWWWIGNQRRTGSFAPTLDEVLMPTVSGFEPDLEFFVRRFGAFFPERFWGWFGLYSARLPLWVIGLATAALLAVVAVGLLRPGGRLRRAHLAIGLLPVALVGAFVVQHAWSLYTRSGRTSFIQGRYLFPVIVPLMVVAAAGLSRLAGRWAPVAALVVGLALHALGFATMLDNFWGAPGDGLGGELRAMVAWSAWPGEALALGAAMAALVTVGAFVVIGRDLATEERPDR